MAELLSYFQKKDGGGDAPFVTNLGDGKLEIDHGNMTMDAQEQGATRGVCVCAQHVEVVGQDENGKAPWYWNAHSKQSSHAFR
jgi:hypothetical protein